MNELWQVSYDGGDSWVDWPRKPDAKRDAGLAMAKVRCVAVLPEQWHPMETAPTDGTLVRLLVQYRGEDACHPLEDAQIAQTIGTNTDSNTGLSEGWRFAGWSWEQDCFTQGQGKPIGWLPLAPVPPGVAIPAPTYGEAVIGAAIEFIESVHQGEWGSRMDRDELLDMLRGIRWRVLDRPDFAASAKACCGLPVGGPCPDCPDALGVLVDVGPGYKLVPVEPTPEILEAMKQATWEGDAAVYRAAVDAASGVKEGDRG